MNLYSQDYDDTLPLTSFLQPPLIFRFPFIVGAYVKNGGIWKCPSDPDTTAIYDGTVDDRIVSYGYNFATLSGMSLAAIGKPAETVVLAEASAATVGPSSVIERHGLMPTIGFLDGHVKAMKKAAVNRPIAAGEGEGSPTTCGPLYNECYYYWNLY